MARHQLREDGPEEPLEPGSEHNRCACGSVSVCDEYRAAFGVALCPHCKAADELLPKGKAKQLYLLNDADIAHLGSIKRENPHKAAWNSMRLYLLSQVEAVAAAKHGGLDELEDRRRSLSLCASERRIAKKRDGEALAQAKEKRIQRLQDKLCAEVEADLSQGAMDSQGGSSGAIMRTYQNGMQVELEKI